MGRGGKQYAIGPVTPMRAPSSTKIVGPGLVDEYQVRNDRMAPLGVSRL